MRRLLIFLVLPFLVTCSNAVFEPIGNRFSAPIAVAVDVARARAYVVNSNNNYEFTDATLSILDITDPAAPVLLDNPANPIGTPNFSGQIYFDPATSLAYVSNRASDDANDTEDALLRINLDESSAAFGAVDSFPGGENPFGVACCDTSGRLYVATSGGTLNVFNPADLSSSVSISLQLILSTGDELSGASSTEVVLLGSQAFVTNRTGRIYVINTDEVGDTSKNPIDYIVLGGEDFRGIATDGTSLFAVDAGNEDDVGPFLRVINPSILTPVDPDVPTISEVDLSTVQTTAVSVGNDPNEVVVFNGRATVTNLDDDTVTVIDTASNAVTATISVGDQPFGMAAFTSGGTDVLYVTNLVSNTISIINLGSNTVVNTFSP